jgi:hypothetical protein
MAVRDDFTAGEVLAAADLNDTFASKPPFAYGTATPSTTVEGFIWYDENDTPPTAKFWDGSAFENIAAPSALSIVTPTSIANSGGSSSASGGQITFTGVTSISLNGVFSSLYDNYQIILNAFGSATFTAQLRLRVGGVDNTTANSYSSQRLSARDTTPASGKVTSTSFDYSYLGTDDRDFSTGNIARPFLAATTRITSSCTPTGTSLSLSDLAIFAGYHNQTTSYDGFTLTASTGNMTGTIRVYGLQNS